MELVTNEAYCLLCPRREPEKPYYERSTTQYSSRLRSRIITSVPGSWADNQELLIVNEERISKDFGGVSEKPGYGLKWEYTWPRTMHIYVGIGT